MLRTLSNTFWILCLAFIALFVFFLALGAFRPQDVIEVTVLAGVLTIAWLVHAAVSGRGGGGDESEGRDLAEMHARERRGF